MKTFLKRLLGVTDNKSEIDAKIRQAAAIKKQIELDSLYKQKTVDAINRRTYAKLKKISDDLSSVTYSIGIATGAQERIR